MLNETVLYYREPVDAMAKTRKEEDGRTRMR